MSDTKRQCPHCGKVASRPSALFCSRCGASLTTVREKPETFEARIKALEFDRSLAVVVGIDDYSHGIPTLTTAGKDARRLARILKDEYGYDVWPLVEDVTLQRLNSLLTDTLPREVGSNDRVIVYFAGHGIALEGEDGPAGYLVPQDGRPEDRDTFLRMDQFHDALMALECRHMLVILDCCFAGAMRWSVTRDIQMVPEVIHQERYERFIRDPAWQLITSAAYDQKALDILSGDVLGERGDLASREHSPFALALFEALAGAGDVVPPGEGDGVITACELYLYLRDYVEVKAEEEEGHYQTPSLWPLRKHDKGEYIFLVPGHELNLPPAPELTVKSNPYRGLRPFEEEHANLFFGRTALVETLVETVSKRPLTVVLGASGTGKSSLVKAGLLSHLGGTGKTDPVVDGEQVEGPWYILPPMRPTESPLRESEYLLRHNLPAFVQVAGDGGLRAAPSALADVIAPWSQAHPGQRLLLVIDQFEELVTLCRNDHEREQFLGLLSTALDVVPGQLRIVLTLRSDFEPQLSDSALRPYWREARFVVPPMSRAELREAIEGPASARVLYFEPSDLVDRLVDEVIQTPGALPLLSFTLSELYIKYIQRRSDDRALTEEDYKALGGVAGSLRSRATEEYEALEPPYQATMKRIMLRMVTSEGGELARRRVLRSELVYPDEVENQRVGAVTRRLAEARLIVGDETEKGEPYVEPAHDALVRAWDKLLVWCREAEEYLPLQRRLTQAARDWAEVADKRTRRDLLWHDDPRLPQIEQALAGDGRTARQRWLARQFARFRDLWRTKGIQVVKGHWLNKLELDFVRRSVVQRRKEARRLVGTVMGVIVALTALTIFALLQLNLANIARDAQATEVIQRTTAEAEAVTAEAIAVRDRGIALTREAEAVRQSRLGLAQSLVANAALIHQQTHGSDLSTLLAIEAYRINQEENGELDISIDNTLRPILDRRAGYFHHVLRGHGLNVWTVAFSSDGRYLASGGDDESIRLWNLHDLAISPIELSNTEVIMWLSFSPDGQTLASSSRDGTIRLWNMEDLSAEPATLPGQPGQVVFSPDGLKLANGGWNGGGYMVNPTNIIQLWNLSTPDREPVQLSASAAILSLAFSPDSQILATGDSDNAISLWSLSDLNQKPVVLYGHGDHVTTVQFSPDGRTLASGSRDKSIRLWDLYNLGNTPTVLQRHEAEVTALVFAPDGQTLASGSEDQTVHLWNLVDPGADPIVLLGDDEAVSTLAFCPDGQLLASGYGGDGEFDDQTVRLWSLRDLGSEPNIIQKEYRGGNGVLSVAFSPDGQTLASGENDYYNVLLWDTINFHQQLFLRGPNGSLPMIYAVAFSPDGQILAGGAWFSVYLWDLKTTSPDAPNTTMSILEGHERNVTSIAFSPDGQTLASSSEDSTIRLWDWNSPEATPLILRGHDGHVRTVAFSPDGKLLASGGEDQTIRLWDLAHLDSEPAILTGHLGGVEAVVFSPSEHTLASGSGDSTIRLWNLNDLQAEPTVLAGHTVAVSSLAFSPDGRFLVSGAEDTTVRLWDLHNLSIGAVVLQGHGGLVESVAFNPSKPIIASSGYDYSVLVWPLLDDLVSIGCQQLLRNLAWAEWTRYLPGQPYRPTCSGLPCAADVPDEQIAQDAECR